MATFKYFSGDEQVHGVTSMDNKAFAAAFPGVVGRKSDGYTKYVGFPQNTDSLSRLRYVGAKPVTRVIEFKSRPSLHKCDSRCRNAKGGQCECECGGKHHGAGN